MLGTSTSFAIRPLEPSPLVPAGTSLGLDPLAGEPFRLDLPLGPVAAEHRLGELSAADVEYLADEVISAHGRGATPFGSYLFAAREPAAELARHVERVVFGESFGCPPEVVAAEYDDYEPASLFLCVLDHRRRLPVGAIRIVVPGPVGFKSLDEIERHWHQCPGDVLARTPVTIDLARTWDIATLMVCPGYRTGVVSQALHQALGTAARHGGVDGFVTILDLAVLRLLQFQLRRLFIHYHGVEPDYYEGSPSLPVWADLERYWPRVRTSHPDLYETMWEGRNLEVVVSAPDWDDALERIGLGDGPAQGRSPTPGHDPLRGRYGATAGPTSAEGRATALVGVGAPT